MLCLSANGMIHNLMWLGRYEGRFSADGVKVSQQEITGVIQSCNHVARGVKGEAPATATALDTVVNKGTTTIGLYMALERARTTICAETTLRNMYILMPGERLPEKDRPSGAIPATAKTSAGGRPRKDYWEDAIVEMFDRLFHGTLTPSSQADIEDAMAQWILDKHHDSPSEASVRSRASKVWKVHKKEG